MRARAPFSSLIAVLTALPLAAQEEPLPFDLKGYGDFTLKGAMDLPDSDEVTRAIILVHGSGQQSMDGDLTAVTRNGERNLFFVELGAALSEVGFAVIRYNKRSYQIRRNMTRQPGFASSESVQQFIANPLLHLVEDCKAAVEHASENFPDASIYLLGHSQGTHVALQAAREDKRVYGAALIGFATSPMSFLQFEQTVYRSLRSFRRLDLDDDESLDEAELAAEDANFLRPQLATLDSNEDGSISRLEFQAASMGSLVLQEPFAGAYLRQEASYPRIPDVLKAMEVEVVFLQGLLDNQTPAYQAMSIELINKQLWKKSNLQFHYFYGLGHALDPRDDYDDVQYRRIDSDAKRELVEILSERFR